MHGTFLHGAGHVTFVIHYTIVSNIKVLSSSWRSIGYRLAYFVLYVTILLYMNSFGCLQLRYVFVYFSTVFYPTFI